MSGSTKVFFAVIGLLVLVLVVYYGYLLPDDEARVVYDEHPSDGVAEMIDRVDREPTRRADDPGVQERDRRTRREPSPSEAQLQPVEDIPAPDAEPDLVVRPEVRPTQIDAADDRPHETDELVDNDAARDDITVKETPGKADVLPLVDVESSSEPDGRADDDAVDQPVEHVEDPVTKPIEVDKPPLPPSPAYTTYSVKAGDTLSTIATEWFGDAGKWDLIAKANPFIDPNRLRIGQELRLPPRDAERDEIEGRFEDGDTIYTVRSGDNLSKIALAYYNDSSLWQLIFEANRVQLQGDPNRLRVGMNLRIPPAQRPAGGEQDQ